MLDTAQLGAVSSGGSSVGADSEDRVPAFVSDEIRTLEGDLESGELELGDPLELSLGSEGREEDSSGGRLILDSSSGAVALVEDSMYRVPPLEMSAEVTPADLMAVYEGLKVVAHSELGTRAVQLGTRSGRVLVSAIPEEDRRAAIGAFSAQAIAFASEDSSGLQYAVRDAGGLHVLVVEVDPRRVFTLLFDSAPDPEHVLALVRPVLSRWRSDLVP